MKTYFISDLHLSEQHPEITKKFQALLQQLPGQCDGLYILGDLFEIWIGDDAASPFQLQIGQLLKNANEHFPIYFMPGNRDFLLGRKFCHQSSMQFLADPTVVSIHDESILLLHGDGLCKTDKLYQVYRKIVRSQLFICLFLTLPLKWRQSIADEMRKNSGKNNQRKLMEWMDISPDALFNLMKKYRVSYAIYGHTHKPSIVLNNPANDLQQIFVLSDWHKQGNALVIDDNSLKNMIYF